MTGTAHPDPGARALRFLAGYPPAVLERARALVERGELGAWLQARYPQGHAVRDDAALYEHANRLRQRHLRHAPPLARVRYDSRLLLDQRALGTLTTVARTQGARLASRREIRIAALFRDAPAPMLEMIVVHELAHLKERDHDRAFYALCEHMLAGYARLELDTRLYLVWRCAGPTSSDRASTGSA